MFNQSVRSTLIAVTIGGMLEWYEFSLYLFLSPVIAQHYFANHSRMIGLLLTAMIFAIGFLSRPIGAFYLAISATATEENLLCSPQSS